MDQEAQGGGVTSPAIFKHEYYPDDMFQQLDVTSSNLNQTGLVAYSYRPDGKIKTQTISDAAQSNVGSTSVAFTYTPAGRLSGRTESGQGANSSPTTLTYDSYGRLSQELFPTCSQCGAQTVNPPLSNLVWDPQGQLMQTAYGTFNYSTRGDALAQLGRTCSPMAFRFRVCQLRRGSADPTRSRGIHLPGRCSRPRGTRRILPAIP